MNTFVMTEDSFEQDGVIEKMTSAGLFPFVLLFFRGSESEHDLFIPSCPYLPRASNSSNWYVRYMHCLWLFFIAESHFFGNERTAWHVQPFLLWSKMAFICWLDLSVAIWHDQNVWSVMACSLSLVCNDCISTTHLHLDMSQSATSAYERVRMMERCRQRNEKLWIEGWIMQQRADTGEKMNKCLVERNGTEYGTRQVYYSRHRLDFCYVHWNYNIFPLNLTNKE